jgi:TRAP transporter TAXI family solute receptor
LPCHKANEKRKGGKRMKKSIALLICLGLVLSLMTGCGDTSGSASDTPEGSANGSASKTSEGHANGAKIKISIGAGSAGGGFHTGATTITNVINTYLDDYEAAVEVVGASANNAALVQEGEIELGMCATETLWEAYHGKADFEGDRQCDKLRSVMPGWGGVYMFITTSDHKINSIEDIDGKSFSTGSVGGSTEVFSRRVFDLFGIQPKEMHLPVSDAARSLSDGTIAGYLQAHPAPAVSEMEVTNDKIRLLVLGEEYKEEFKKAYPQYVWLDIPAGYYKALPEKTHGAGLYNMVITSVDIDEEMIYQIVKACYENRDYMKIIHPQFAEEMDFKYLDMATVPYHIGAIRYFEEEGAQLNPELYPPEYNK